MDLFVPVKPTFATKTASTPLDDDPQRWSQQVLQELYRQVPEASEYSPKVVFFRQDPEQGFAFGALVISAQTDSALTGSEESPTSRRAVIPVIIRNTELAPLDIIITQGGKYLPLTSVRLREALFRPNTFDMMTDDRNEGSLYSLFYPPGRSANNPGSGTSTMGASGEVGYIQGPGMKFSHVESLANAIAPTLSRHALDEFAEKLSSDALSNPCVLAIAETLARYEDTLMHGDDAEALVKKASSYAETHVVQFGYSFVDGYWMKTASRDMFAPERVLVSRGDILKIAGPEIAMKVDTQGTVTLAEPAVDPNAMEDTATWAPVTESGVYRVKDVTGKEYTGWVLPNLMDFQGTRLPMAAFTNGAVAATQDKIVGSKVSRDAANLPEHPVKGTGLFYVVTADGIDATVPVKVLGGEAAMDGSDVYHVTTLLGESHELMVVPGLKALTFAGGKVMLPESVRFLALDTEAPVMLMDDVPVAKTASALLAPSIEIRHDGIDPSLRFNGLPNLESFFLKNASYDNAILVLCAGGMAPVDAHKVIKSAAVLHNTEVVRGLQDVRTADEVFGATSKTASEKVSTAFSLRKDLIKEAAVLPDIQTVDAVLSLGFINPENVYTYVSKLPYLEKALNSICELTLASRLGLNEISDTATARAARALDETIQGLKGLALRSRDEGGTVA